MTLSYPFVPRVSPHFSVQRIVDEHTGIMRVRRLLFAAERCPPIAVEAFRIALQELKQAQPLRSFATAANQPTSALSGPMPLGPNTQLYQEVVTRARDLFLAPASQPEHVYFQSAAATAQVPLAQDPLFSADQSFWSTLQRSFQESQSNLENQLLVQKRDGEREGIKVASLNLAQFYANRGELNHALNKYLEAKEFVTPQPGPQQSAELLHISLAIIKASVLMINMSHVKTQVQRAQRIVKEMQQAAAAPAATASAAAAGGSSEKDERELDIINCKLNAAHGLFHMKGQSRSGYMS